MAIAIFKMILIAIVEGSFLVLLVGMGITRLQGRNAVAPSTRAWGRVSGIALLTAFTAIGIRAFGHEVLGALSGQGPKAFLDGGALGFLLSVVGAVAVVRDRKDLPSWPTPGDPQGVLPNPDDRTLVITVLAAVLPVALIIAVLAILRIGIFK